MEFRPLILPVSLGISLATAILLAISAFLYSRRARPIQLKGMPAAPRTNHIRVLVADDEENQRAGLAKMIQSWGFAVETAFDGQDALEKLAQTPTACSDHRSDDAAHGRLRAVEAPGIAEHPAADHRADGLRKY